MHFPILLCHTFMHRWKDSPRMLLRSDVMISFKTGPLFDPFEHGKKRKKTHGARSGKYGDNSNSVVFFQHFNCSGFCDYLHCRGEAVKNCPVKILGLLVHWTKHTPLDLLVDLLTLWQEVFVDDAQTWSTGFWLWLSCFLWPPQRWILPVTALVLDIQIPHKNPSLIRSDHSTKQVWFILKTLPACQNFRW